MNKIIKLCGTEKSYIILPEDEKLESSLIYFCNNCKRETKENIFLCYPKIKDKKYLKQ